MFIHTEFTDKVMVAMDRLQTAADLVCDLSRAFEHVVHSVFMSNLFGIGGNYFTFFKSYFSDNKLLFL